MTVWIRASTVNKKKGTATSASPRASGGINGTAKLEMTSNLATTRWRADASFLPLLTTEFLMFESRPYRSKAPGFDDIKKCIGQHNPGPLVAPVKKL
jgi:hypothetical protein